MTNGELNIPKRGSAEYWDYIKKAGVTAMRRKKKGRPKKVETPEKFWEIACEYFKSVDLNPLIQEDFIKGGEAAGSKVRLNKMRPYTWTGLTEYFAVNGILSALDDYKFNAGGAYEEYRDVIARIDNIIFTQKFEGAASGFFKEGIIMRDLKLDDNLKVNQDGDVKITIIDKK